MKCYFCRADVALGAHSIGCPSRVTSPAAPHKKPSTIFSSEPCEGVEDGTEALLAMGGSPSPPPKGRPILRPDVYTSFLGIATKDGSSVASCASMSISASPQEILKPQRLWIDEELAVSFVIENIYVGVRPMLPVGSSPIPANVFRTGRWPLKPGAEEIEEFGIQLQGWPSIQPNQQFTLIVRNISFGILPFRACLEGLTIR